MRPLDDHLSADNAVSGTVYLGDDVGLVFLRPTTSSSCTSWVSPGTGGSSGRLATYAFTQLMTDRWATPSVSARSAGSSARLHPSRWPCAGWPRHTPAASVPACTSAYTPGTSTTGCPMGRTRPSPAVLYFDKGASDHAPVLPASKYLSAPGHPWCRQKWCIIPV